MNSEIQQEVRSAGIRRAWVGIELAAKEVQGAEREIHELESKVTTLDSMNVFSDSPEEARIKVCKDRIKSRTEEYNNFALETGAFITKLGEKYPDFQVATSLEGFLGRVLRASQPSEFKSLGKDILQWLSAFSEHLGEIKEAPLASSILEQLFVGPYQHTRRALCELHAPLDLIKRRTEHRWDKAVNVLSLRPLFLVLVGECREAFAKDCEGTPLPFEVYQSLVYEKKDEQIDPVDELLRDCGESELMECVQKSLLINRAIAGYKALITINRSDISTLDRVVFWSDTDAEAREKRWKTQMKEQQKALQDSWLQLCQKNQEIRDKVWTTFLLDLGHRVKTLVLRIHASDPTGLISKTSQVMEREPAVMVVERFRSTVFARYPFYAEVSELRQRSMNSSAKCPPVVCDSLGNPPTLRPPELVAQLSSKLLETGFLDEQKGADELAKREREEKQRKAREYEKKSTLGRIGHLFTAAAGQITEGFQFEESPGDQLEQHFLGVLEDVHSPTLLNILLHRLVDQLFSIDAEVGSNKIYVGDNGTRTEYYGKLIGYTPALATATQLSRLLNRLCVDSPFAMEWLGQFATNPVVEGIEAHPLRF